MEDYSKYQVPRYKTVYTAKIENPLECTEFHTLELALEFMRQKLPGKKEVPEMDVVVFADENRRYGYVYSEILPT